MPSKIPQDRQITAGGKTFSIPAGRHETIDEVIAATNKAAGFEAFQKNDQDRMAPIWDNILPVFEMTIIDVEPVFLLPKK